MKGWCGSSDFSKLCMEFLKQVLQLLVTSGLIYSKNAVAGSIVLAKSYQPIEDHCLRVFEVKPTESAILCLVLCEQNFDCHAILWTNKTPPCVLLSDRIGNRTAASVDETAPIRSSKFPAKRSNFQISFPILGISNDSSLENVYCHNPLLHYKSLYKPNSSYVVDFKIHFPMAVNVSTIELIHLDLGINQTAPTFAHWHSNNEIPYCQPMDALVVGSVIRFSCPFTANLTRLTYHVEFQGYLAFNSLKLSDSDNKPIIV